MLLSNGQPNARHYPIAVVWSESRIIRQREARTAQQNAILFHTAMTAAVGGLFDKNSSKPFNELLKTMDNVD